MRILGLIPSRMESARFPDKPLVDIHGKSMIRRVYEQAIASEMLDEVYVVTDSNDIKAEIERYGGKCILTSSKPRNGTERCLEAYIKLDEEFDAIINIQGDEPYIQPQQIDLLADLMRDTKVNLGTLVIKDARPEAFISKSTIKVVLNKVGHALYFSRSPIPTNAKVFYRHIGMYAYRPDTLMEIVSLAPGVLETLESLEQLRWLENDYKIHVAETTHDSESVDTPDDLQYILEKYSGRNV
ncbi:MAG: 3-deoxy-manno-octulosonate cytidylyltransferase [Bacteroidia bacterium]|nr:3-deoxy-manno-octulosonate cytidylyltransferase [Bacteroidia bacterium]